MGGVPLGGSGWGYKSAMEEHERDGASGSPPAASDSPSSRHFFYNYRSNGTKFQLKVPLRLPLSCTECSELAVRLVTAHRLPCYLEEDLRGELERAARCAYTEATDRAAEEKMYGGSVFEEVGGVCSKVSEHKPTIVFIRPWLMPDARLIPCARRVQKQTKPLHSGPTAFRKIVSSFLL